MTAIVRKRAYTSLSRVARANPYVKRARMAYGIGSFAWRNRKNIYRAARRFSRMRRNRAGRHSPRNFGENINSANSKRQVPVNSDELLRSNRTLYVDAINNIPRGDGINERKRSIVNYRGAKICFDFRSIAASPCHLNVAVLAPKDGTLTVNENDFFRGSGDRRARDFDLTLTSQDFHCLNINTDKYTILRHKRYMLAAEGPTTVFEDNTSNSYVSLRWWIPVRRQLRYDEDQSTPESGKMFFVYWYDNFQRNSGSAVQQGTGVAMTRIVNYFREPKN